MWQAFPFTGFRTFARLILAVMGVGTLSTVAHGWVTIEHIHIGEASYHQACDYFRRPDIVRTAEQQALAARFCFQDTTWARHYGELTAYGGDYAATPEDIPTDFTTMSARLANLSDWAKVGNLLHRALLALKDGTHFQPHAQDQWLQYHRRALERARHARRDQEYDQGFRNALILNDFADHFLQDAFSAGHNGTNRKNTIPSLQKVYHDAFCCWGRFLGDGLGNTWFTLGDGGLDKPCNTEGKERMIAAAAESVRSLLWVFIIGESAYKSPQEVFAYLPKRYANQPYRVIPPAYDAELCPRPDFPIIRYKGRYVKCSEADFFAVYINPQLGRSAPTGAVKDQQRWQAFVPSATHHLR